ncbi:hypothetical protein [Parasphingorhabdus halotolerans]|uniref:Uncharacterized protein n=1 Tax=Parasphingorhabdus halotolerans TaxID=2725558 RepID=A0A6H2DM09_9SPHN|nr:hypothetical protein [Parasphingorhabdus halotolerans]QJB68696.1 hypothetical protein HF685_04875 [Parasphingorhabdus halotolerans]
MGNAANITGWITFFIGLYSVAAGIGEFRRPGFWASMVREVRASSAIRFLVGMVTIAIGAAIYLTNPYNPKDILSILITVMGAFIFLEGAVILAFGDWFLGVAGKMMNAGNKIWAGLSIVIGVAAIFVALVRLQV